MADALDQMMAGFAAKRTQAPAPTVWAARADTAAHFGRERPAAAAPPPWSARAPQPQPAVAPAASGSAALPPATLAWPAPHGSALEQNARHRAYMEDAVLHEPDLLQDGGGSFALHAVYDGHGGRAAVDFIAAQLHRNVAAELRASRGAGVRGCLERAFLRADAALKPAGAYAAGTTAALVLLAREAGGGVRLHAANCGDSHIVLIHRQPPPQAPAPGAGGADGAARGVVSGEGVERLSEEHSGKVAAEADRIQAAGGTMAYGRVGGSLAVTRALGDHALKASAGGAGLSALPATLERSLDARQHLALVLGSDGVWDTLTDADIGQIARQVLQAPGGALAGGADCAAAEVARRLVRAAIERGSRDNVSAICVVLAPAAV